MMEIGLQIAPSRVASMGGMIGIVAGSAALGLGSIAGGVLFLVT